MYKEFPKIKTELVNGKWTWKWIDEEPSNFHELFREELDHTSIIACAYIPTESDLKKWINNIRWCYYYKWTIPGIYVLERVGYHDDIEYEAVHVDKSCEIENCEEMIDFYNCYLNALKSNYPNE